MITAAADGSSLSNPGPAGWAWYVDDQHWAAGGWPHGTNNMGELMAVLDLLRQTASSGDDLHVLCDSQYVINSVSKWMPGWKRKGWRKGDGKPVMNVELLQEIDREITGRRVTFEWVKGHAGHDMNEAADLRARAAATAFRDGRPVDHGPGFDGAGSAPLTAPVDAPSQPATEPTLFDELPPEPAASAAAATASADPDVVVVLQQQESLLSDAVRSDYDAAAALLHRDLVEVGADGRTTTRGRLLATIAPLAASTMVEWLGADRIGDGAVLVRWRATTGRRAEQHAAVWQQAASGWQLRHHQATPVL